MEGIKNMNGFNDVESKIFGPPIPFLKMRLRSALDLNHDVNKLWCKLGFEEQECFVNWWNGLVETNSYPRKLVRFIELVDGIGNRLTSEEIKRFFGESHPDLYNDRPIDVLETELGYYAVRRILTNIILGEYA